MQSQTTTRPEEFQMSQDHIVIVSGARTPMGGLQGTVSA
jgi:hypothetical protein